MTLTKADKWVPVLAKYGLTLDDVVQGYEDADWRSEIVDDDYTDGIVTNVYYFENVLKPGDTATLFKTINIPRVFTKDDLTFVAGQFELDIVADAIQAENTADNAFDAFDQFWS